MIERRHFERVRRGLRIALKNEQVNFDGITLDICQGGVFVISGQTLPSGSVVDVELWLADDEPVHCRGEVTWVNRGQVAHYPPGFGVQFVDLSQDSMDCVLDACAEAERELAW